MKSNVRVIRRKGVRELLVQFLDFVPNREIIRIARVGWAQVEEFWVFARPDGVITPPGMPQAKRVSYQLDAAATQHGLHVAGTTAGWKTSVA
jgi:hypothetical protein